MRIGCGGECLNMREEITGRWRKIHSQELIMCVPNTNRIIKSRQKRWTGT
jgi:hypothetical protein